PTGGVPLGAAARVLLAIRVLGPTTTGARVQIPRRGRAPARRHVAPGGISSRRRILRIDAQGESRLLPGLGPLAPDAEAAARSVCRIGSAADAAPARSRSAGLHLRLRE